MVMVCPVNSSSKYLVSVSEVTCGLNGGINWEREKERDMVYQQKPLYLSSPHFIWIMMMKLDVHLCLCLYNPHPRWCTKPSSEHICVVWCRCLDEMISRVQKMTVYLLLINVLPRYSSEEFVLHDLFSIFRTAA